MTDELMLFPAPCSLHCCAGGMVGASNTMKSAQSPFCTDLAQAGESPRWEWLTIGSVFAAFAWLVGSALLS